MSEKLIPIEALSIIPKVNEEELSKIASLIEKREHIIIKSNKRETIIKPDKIKCTHGFYKLCGFDYLSNKVEEFSIGERLEIPEKNVGRFTIKVPNFQDDDLKKETYLKQLEKVIGKAKNSNNYIRIKYGDRNGNITLRTIRNFSIHNTVKETYLIGYCMVRKAERNFHFDRIQFLEVLNLKQPVSN